MHPPHPAAPLRRPSSRCGLGAAPRGASRAAPVARPPLRRAAATNTHASRPSRRGSPMRDLARRGRSARAEAAPTASPRNCRRGVPRLEDCPARPRCTTLWTTSRRTTWSPAPERRSVRAPRSPAGSRLRPPAARRSRCPRRRSCSPWPWQCLRCQWAPQGWRQLAAKPARAHPGRPREAGPPHAQWRWQHQGGHWPNRNPCARRPRGASRPARPQTC
mmetsp:Transcript_35559/g.110868  ORF Transcript_35559/g.110868 Transcript_35559/m.110868 type:complete len:218 (-) Transcript_35559:336-989(-)